MNRRSLLQALPAAAAFPAVVAAPGLAAPTDPLVDLCERYIKAFDAWEEASEHEGEGNFNGPLTTRIDAEKGRLAEAIKVTPITTAAGFAAYCRFVHVDNFMRDESEDWPDMARWQWNKIKEWSEARALIGGAG